ncbi:pyrin domain-containing protein 1 [Embiotoca jacksoni]|uniref:pyrin domain-containing protein 1 n=1 Tax=Embiotoca jacksoni TaxID=100190 RepID=UPI00370400E1
MLVPQLLLETLEDVLNDDFKKFKWYLSMNVLDCCKPIPKAYLENASRIDTVTKMIASYGQELAVDITVDILRKMCLNAGAERLKKAYTEGTAAPTTTTTTSTTTTSTSTSTPIATHAVSAQQGSVVIAPMLHGGATGSWNITIEKS